MPSNSQPGQDFIEGMSVIQIEPGRCLAAHKLDEISSRHVSNSNEVQKLTCWMGFYGGMSNRAQERY